MNALEKIRYALRDRVAKVVAKETGLHWQTIMKLKSGSIKEAKIDTIRRLSDYLGLGIDI